MKLREKVNTVIFVILLLSVGYIATGLIIPDGIAGTDGSQTASDLLKALPSYTTCITIIVLGILFLLLSELVVVRAKNKRSLTFLSLFAMCIAIWALAANPLWLAFLGNGRIAEAAAHVALVWALGFLVLNRFFPNGDEPSLKLWWLLLLPFFYGILIAFLDGTGILSFEITNILTQLFALAVGIDIVLRSVLSIITDGFSLGSSKTIQSLNNLLVVFAAIVDVIRTLALNAKDYSRDLRFALLVFMIIIGIDAIMIYADEQHLIEGAGVIRSLAVHDGLTGVYNRMAFNSKLDTLPLNENIGFVHFDVNNLKKANDTYGHAEGDALIKTIAHGIDKAFSGLGETYRYGGDEFTVITDQYNEDRIKDCLGNLRIYLALMNREDIVHVRLSMACGYDCYRKGDESIFKAFERADEKMYENKRGMKELEERLGRM